MRPRNRPHHNPEAQTPVSTAVVPAQPVRTRPKDVRDMNRDELQAYAMELGLMKRALELPDDRLRQNIMAFLAEMYENAA